MNNLNLNEKTHQTSMLAVSSLDSIPKANPGAAEITGLVKRSGKVTGYRLSDGRVITREEGVMLAKKGEIAGVGIAHRRNTEYLKSIPDGSDENNLSNLPTV